MSPTKFPKSFSNIEVQSPFQCSGLPSTRPLGFPGGRALELGPSVFSRACPRGPETLNTDGPRRHTITCVAGQVLYTKWRTEVLGGFRGYLGT